MEVGILIFMLFVIAFLTPVLAVLAERYPALKEQYNGIVLGLFTVMIIIFIRLLTLI